MKSEFIGSILILVGTAIGAGMLALPLVAGTNGFFISAVLLITVWMLVVVSSLLLLEVNLAFRPYHNSFSTMAYETLGSFGKVIAWISCLLLLYTLAAAYIAGSASLLSVAVKAYCKIQLPLTLYALLFTIVLGVAVFYSTKAVDHFNRGLVSIKGILLIFTFVFLLPHIDLEKLVRTSIAGKSLLIAAPIFLCSFGFQTVIPSLTNYVGSKPKTLKWIIIIGATIPLICYLLWLIITLGIVPYVGQHSFSKIAAKHESVGEVMRYVGIIVHSKLAVIAINAFSDIAMATSFLGVTLGLFDFLADALKRKNTTFGRLQTSLFTFTPPLLFALLYPKGFVMALGHASIFVAIIGLILPAFMAYRLRKSMVLSSTYRVFGGTALLIIIGLSGVVLILMQLGFF